MSVAALTLIVGAVTAAISAGVTLYSRRKTSPDAQASIVTASSLLLSQLQDRVLALEKRNDQLEDENAQLMATNLRYLRIYGPLE